MKKEYKTPYLIMESFQLNAAVATSCSGRGVTPINHSIDSCDLEDEKPGLGYFGAACDTNVMEDWGGDDDDTFCYHGPIDPETKFLAS